MKAILVIDMPTDCIKCPLANGYCWNTFPTKGKADGCPLKPMPEKDTYEPHYNHEYSKAEIMAYTYGLTVGRNLCIEEIENG